MTAGVETARLLLRPFEPDDVPAYGAIRSKPEVTRFLKGGEAAAADGHRRAAELIAEWQTMRESVGFGPWAVVEKATGRLIGSGGLRVRPDLSSDPEVLYAFDTSAWGKGYATEVATAAVRYAFGTLEARRVYGLVVPGNTASQAVLTKAGLAFRRLVTLQRELALRDAERADG